MDDVSTPSLTHATKTKSQIRAADIPSVIDHYQSDIKVLSLDCFDTLLWRKTAAPKDVFYEMQHRLAFRACGVTAYQRIAAASRAYREKFITHGTRQVSLPDIYKVFTALSPEQQAMLVEEELQAEIDACYAFPAFVDLIRQANSHGIKVIIVSDTYLDETQLHRLLAHHLPADVMPMIDKIFCSMAWGKSKSDGLFQKVLQQLEIPANAILHIGDHNIADSQAPAKAGLKALHFLQFDQKTTQFLQMHHAAASLAFLSDPAIHHERDARYSLFRGIFAMGNNLAEKPETLIGYMTFGPLLYAFAHFICDEINKLEQAQKKPKVVFLLRDAYLLSQACETYAGKSVGKLARIRKFLAVAAAFRTQADVDDYISGIEPQHYNLWVICEQLLLPKALAQQIIQLAERSQDPQQTFNQLIHQDNVLTIIFEQSAGARARLKKYLQKELQLAPGDTLVLVDTGYVGVTQKFLARALQEELGIDIIGRYFIASQEPNRPPCESLLTSSWCEHGLFEQSCTYKEGAVLDYDNEGNPIFDAIKLSDEQYAKVNAIQTECLRFIRDAKEFFAKANMSLSLDTLQKMAAAGLKRHTFLPMIEEINYFKCFQHDKDMGPNLTKTMYNVDQAQQLIKQSRGLDKSHPYETRAIGIDVSLSALIQRAFDLDIPPQEANYAQEKVQVIIMNGDNTSQMQAVASKTQEGYFSLCISAPGNAHLGILFGEHYQWLQIDTIKVVNDPTNSLAIENHISFNQMKQQGTLFECESTSGLVVIKGALANQQTLVYQIIFRPLIDWQHASPKNTSAAPAKTKWITSMESFVSLIMPVLTMVKPKRIGEIGAAEGGNTRVLYEFLKEQQGQLVTIDPFPRGSFVDWVKQSNQVVTHLSDYSLNCIHKAGRVDAWFVDGDHNWYTVFNELHLIDQLAKTNGIPALIFLHDIGWPCGRRDMYYDPSKIPAEHRQPYSSELGVMLDKNELINGGLKGPSWALQEGGPKNGVLTGVEDFIQSTPTKYHWINIPAVLGLGILVAEAHPFAKAIIEFYAPYHNNAVLALMEHDRISQYLAATQ